MKLMKEEELRKKEEEKGELVKLMREEEYRKKKENKIELMELMRGEEDKEREESKIIMHFVKESKKDNGYGRGIEDKETVMEIFREEMGMTRVVIEKVVRLGRKTISGEGGQERRRRPLMVTFGSPGQKWGVIKNARKLRSAVNVENRKVKIYPDLTHAERQNEFKLREQLWQKRQAGELGWFISRGVLQQEKVRVGRSRMEPTETAEQGSDEIEEQVNTVEQESNVEGEDDREAGGSQGGEELNFWEMGRGQRR